MQGSQHKKRYIRLHRIIQCPETSTVKYNNLVIVSKSVKFDLNLTINNGGGDSAKIGTISLENKINDTSESETSRKPCFSYRRHYLHHRWKRL